MFFVGKGILRERGTRALGSGGELTLKMLSAFDAQRLPRLSSLFTYYPSRRQVTRALRAFIDVMKGDGNGRAVADGAQRRAKLDKAKAGMHANIGTTLRKLAK